jgi:hypothetical protein
MLLTVAMIIGNTSITHISVGVIDMDTIIVSLIVVVIAMDIMMDIMQVIVQDIITITAETLTIIYTATIIKIIITTT